MQAKMYALNTEDVIFVGVPILVNDMLLKDPLHVVFPPLSLNFSDNDHSCSLELAVLPENGFEAATFSLQNPGRYCIGRDPFSNEKGGIPTGDGPEFSYGEDRWFPVTLSDPRRTISRFHCEIQVFYNPCPSGERGFYAVTAILIPAPGKIVRTNRRPSSDLNLTNWEQVEGPSEIRGHMRFSLGNCIINVVLKRPASMPFAPPQLLGSSPTKLVFRDVAADPSLIRHDVSTFDGEDQRIVWGSRSSVKVNVHGLRPGDLHSIRPIRGLLYANQPVVVFATPLATNMATHDSREREAWLNLIDSGRKAFEQFIDEGSDSSQHGHGTSDNGSTPDRVSVHPGVQRAAQLWQKGLPLACSPQVQAYVDLDLVKDTAVVVRTDSVSGDLDEEQSRLTATWLSTLSHPCLVRFYGGSFDHDPANDSWSVTTVTDCIPYAELSTVPNGLHEFEVAMCARDVLGALIVLHDSGFVHGHVSASSVLLNETADGETSYLLNCSPCRTADGNVPDSLAAGRNNDAPELVAAQPLTTSFDVWCLGCVTYEALAGEPLQFLSDGSIDFSLLAHLENDCCEFVAACLTLPDERPTARQALEFPWIASALSSWIGRARLTLLLDQDVPTKRAQRYPCHDSESPFPKYWTDMWEREQARCQVSRRICGEANELSARFPTLKGNLTLMEMAFGERHVKRAVKRLLELGVSPYGIVDTDREWSALIFAAYRRNREAVSLFVECRALEGALADSVGGLAVVACCLGIVDFDDGCVVLHNLLAAGANPNLVDAHGRSPLSIVLSCDAARFDVPQALRTLLRAGADPNIGMPETLPLVVVCQPLSRDSSDYWRARRSTARAAMATELVEAGANFDATAPIVQFAVNCAEAPDSDTAAMGVRLFAALLAAGLELDALAVPRGSTFAHTVARTGRIDALLLVVAHGADINAVNDCGESPLACILESWKGEGDSIAPLLEHGADANGPGGLSVSPLAVASRYSMMNVAILVEAGADVNARCAKWDSPLVSALSDGTMEVAEFLLRRGADPEDVDHTAGCGVIQRASGGDARFIPRLARAVRVVLECGGADPQLLAAFNPVVRVGTVRVLAERIVDAEW